MSCSKYLGSLMLTAGVFFLGYKTNQWLNGHARYTIKEYGDTPYLIDTERYEKYEIKDVNNTLQLGGIEQRINSLLGEYGYDNLLNHLQGKDGP